MPAAVVLYIAMGVGGFGCPMSCNVLWHTVPPLHVMNSAPVLASAVKATTWCSVLHSTKISPLTPNNNGMFGSFLINWK